MPRQTKAELKQINAELMTKLQNQTTVASHYYAEIESLKRQLSLCNSRFDRLLDGMCMGMKEANLPRRIA
jgi:hypothetical protein